MNTYNVEVKRTSYINMQIEASSKEEAEEKMWEEIEYRSDSTYAEWELTLCEEVQHELA